MNWLTTVVQFDFVLYKSPKSNRFAYTPYDLIFSYSMHRSNLIYSLPLACPLVVGLSDDFLSSELARKRQVSYSPSEEACQADPPIFKHIKLAIASCFKRAAERAT